MSLRRTLLAGFLATAGGLAALNAAQAGTTDLSASPPATGAPGTAAPAPDAAQNPVDSSGPGFALEGYSSNSAASPQADAASHGQTVVVMDPGARPSRLMEALTYLMQFGGSH